MENQDSKKKKYIKPESVDLGKVAPVVGGGDCSPTGNIALEGVFCNIGGGNADGCRTGNGPSYGCYTGTTPN